MNIAIIPARGGSKRIPGKNIKPFAGKPVIGYSIEAALCAEIFDQVIVSTDSEKIAETAKECGAAVPFIRPAELSDDHTPTAPVIEHALKWFIANGKPVSYACCIYATAPFVKPSYIQEGYNRITSKNLSSVFSVTSFPFPVFRALKITGNGSLEMIWPEYEMARSNDLIECYHDAGQFYWLNCDRFLKTLKIYGEDAEPVILPRYRVQDIDTPEDWKTAEHMYQALKLSEKI